MALTGFSYYWQKLGLDTSSYLVHYDFANSGITVPSTQSAQTQYSGILSGVAPNFWSVSGSGHFGSGAVAISHASGLVSDFWTHFFIYEKTDAHAGILFSSLQGYSGYAIGVTDNNSLFFESYGQLGPNVQVSSEIYGQKNAVAVVKAGNVLSFHNYNFDTKSLISESFTIPAFIKASNQASIGGIINPPSYIRNDAFHGYIDDYVYVTEAITSTNLLSLFSGFYSEYTVTAPIVAYSGYTGILGYTYTFSGVTGIVGWNTQQTINGTDPFGDPIYSIVQVPQTGYLWTGLLQTPITGWIQIPITGQASGNLRVDNNYGLVGFGLNEISYLRSISSDDYSSLNVFASSQGISLNNVAVYDKIHNAFQLDGPYADQIVQLYCNGIYQQFSGYGVTGNAFISGYVLSGDYFMQGYFVNSTGAYISTDTIIFDVLSGNRSAVANSSYNSGSSLPISLSTPKNIFLNGLKLLSGVDFDNRAGFAWLHNAEGQVVTVDITGAYASYIGTQFGILPLFQRDTTQLFLNGQRQLKDYDYVENSALDLIGNSGLFETDLVSIYNNVNTFLE